MQEIALKSGFGVGIDPATCTAVPAELVAWTVHAYDAFGNRTSTRRVRDFATQAGPLHATAYDANGLYPVQASRSGLKNADTTASTQSATLVHDALGRLRQGIDADWHRTDFDYDERNRPVRILGLAFLDASDGSTRRPVTRCADDALGRLTEVLAGRADAGGSPGSEALAE